MSAQLTQSRAKAISSPTDFESVVDNLEDAVALFGPDGKMLFSNPAMKTLLPETTSGARSLIERTLASRQPESIWATRAMLARTAMIFAARSEPSAMRSIRVCDTRLVEKA